MMLEEKTLETRRLLRIRTITAWTLGLLSFLLYAFTAEPTVSFWDCPEYVASAVRLEPGHPPGNPIWMLTAHFFTLLVPAEKAALAVNLMSGVCSAGAVSLLFLTLFIMLWRLTAWRDDYAANEPEHGRRVPLRRAFTILFGSIIGALVFAVSDTFWFSAVEAEVYAFSALLTALSLWLAFVWGEKRHEPHSSRYLVLAAYVTGLSIGVHQLNLLVLPAFALVIVFYENRNLRRGVLTACMVASLVVIAAVLFAMMPGVLNLGAEFELLAVNRLGLPLHSGLIFYVALTVALLLTSALLGCRGRHRTAVIIVGAVALFLSGVLSFGGKIWVGLALGTLLGVAGMIRRRRLNMAGLNITLFGVLFLFLGYCSYGIIMIRGAANPPMNQGTPDNIFALRSYIERDQYGENPLLRGRTPYSKPLMREDVKRDTLTGKLKVSYTEFYRDPAPRRYMPLAQGGVVKYFPLADRGRLRYPPELDMWLPRIYSGADIDAYGGWTGMTPETMDSVEVSYAVDSLGDAVGRLDPETGKRSREKLPKPTYLQNFAMLGGYQVSYMYLRYLMWNFVGRQNDVYAQGEPDAGNFITGIGPVDGLIYSSPEPMPRDIGGGNAGHHVYWFLPLLLGCFGMAFQLNRGRRGKRQFAVVMLLFILTGVAIVVYLNQTPGQPRERDYSFVGSFYAFALWTGCGAAALAGQALHRWRTGGKWRRALAVAGVLFAVAVPVLMAVENFPDHNRAGRRLTRELSIPMLENLPKDAILFVNGDNYTFPLWYLQEVEGIRRDVRTVNLAYLGTTWLAPQLATATDGARPIRLSIPKEKLNEASLEPYEIVYLGVGTGDAREVLKRLFETTPDSVKRPSLPVDRVRLLPYGMKDSITIDLRKASGGHSYLRIGQLLTLDMLASNPDRPIVWNTSARSNGLFTLDSLVHREFFNYRLCGTQDSTAFDTQALLKLRRLPTDVAGSYVDPPGRIFVYQYRLLMLRTAEAQLRFNTPEGTRKALELVQLSERIFPPEAVPYATRTEHGEPYSEALTLAKIYLELGKRLNREEFRNYASDLLDAEIARTREYKRYLDAMPAAVRRYAKPQTRLAPRLLDSTLNLRRSL